MTRGFYYVIGAQTFSALADNALFIAAIALTLRSRKDTRHTVASEQVKVRKSDRLRVVKMDAVVPAAAAVETEEGQGSK